MPTQQILKKYSDVLVKFALGGGKGVKKGEVVCIQVRESAKPILEHLEKTVLEMGAHPVIVYLPEGTDRKTLTSRTFLENANEEQLDFYPQNYLLSKIKDCDHFLYILSADNKKEFEGIDGKKLFRRNQAYQFVMNARNKKEDEGKLTWTLANYGTEAMAKEAGLSLDEYWQQIIKACYLDLEEPISKWQETYEQIEKTQKWLNEMQIEWLHVEADVIDLKVKLGEGRKWMGGSGRNVPTFELFTSPDWRGTDGKIKFNFPLFHYGNLITDIELEFKDGIVVNSKAGENYELLKDMLDSPNANKVGEYSLTDKRFSRIDKFMADTLFDENYGGEFGNTHIALGSSYHDCYSGDIQSMTEADWERLGYNSSPVHTDIISTSNRMVTATLPDGSERVIYKDGMFQIN